MNVPWTEPTAIDNSGMIPTVTQSHQSGDSFNIGTTQVIYTFEDMAGNQAQCSFTVTLGNETFHIFDRSLEIRGEISYLQIYYLT